MPQWVKRVRGVVMMGLIWAAYGLAAGGAIELLDNVWPGGLPGASAVDMWPQTLAVLFFRRGVVFAVVLGIARGRRRFEQFSLGQFAAWGAVAGLVLGVIALALGAGAGFVAVTTLLSAAAGAGSLALARAAERGGLLGAGGRAPAAGLPAGESRPLLGRRD